MNAINKTFTLTYQWDKNDYRPDVRFHLSVNETGFLMHITVPESNPRREMTQHFQPVCLDSCVEWFVNFMPEKCERYFNFEVNALGTVYASFRRDRQDPETVRLTMDEIESMNIQPVIYEDFWEVSYCVPFALIEKYIPGYVFEKGMTIKANFYKCGGHTEQVHHGVWNPILIEKPDFHRPDFFGEIVLD